MRISQIIFIFPTVTMIFPDFKSQGNSVGCLHLTQETLTLIQLPFSTSCSIFYSEVAWDLKYPG